MPDHIHGLLKINKPKRDFSDEIRVGTRHCLVPTTTNTDDTIDYRKLRFRNPGKQKLSSIIGSYKSIVSRMSHKINESFTWQSRFYDKIIHDLYELMHYQDYIKNNPLNVK
jgi:REP element-mobilizing transposase RayT